MAYYDAASGEIVGHGFGPDVGAVARRIIARAAPSFRPVMTPTPARAAAPAIARRVISMRSVPRTPAAPAPSTQPTAAQVAELAQARAAAVAQRQAAVLARRQAAATAPARATSTDAWGRPTTPTGTPAQTPATPSAAPAPQTDAWGRKPKDQPQPSGGGNGGSGGGGPSPSQDAPPAPAPLPDDGPPDDGSDDDAAEDTTDDGSDDTPDDGSSDEEDVVSGTDGLAFHLGRGSLPAHEAGIDCRIRIWREGPLVCGVCRCDTSYGPVSLAARADARVVGQVVKLLSVLPPEKATATALRTTEKAVRENLLAQAAQVPTSSADKSVQSAAKLADDLKAQKASAVGCWKDLRAQERAGSPKAAAGTALVRAMAKAGAPSVSTSGYFGASTAIVPAQKPMSPADHAHIAQVLSDAIARSVRR